jgi:signal transduction histidine kinase
MRRLVPAPDVVHEPCPYRGTVTSSVWSWLDRAVPWAVWFLLSAVALDSAEGATLAFALALAAGQAVALRWRHDHPEVVTAAVLVLGAAYHAVAPSAAIPFGPIAAVWALASARPPQRSLFGLAGLLAVTSLGFIAVPDDLLAEDVWFVLLVDVCVWALAEAGRSRSIAAEDRARRAVRDEQARIARELHDVIAHSVTVMVVQAGAAGDVFDQQPDRARTALATIEEVGRATLVELRRLLSGVRPTGPDDRARIGETDDPPDAEAIADGDRVTAPQPGLARIGDLARPLQAAGVAVEIVHDGEPRPVSAGMDVSAFRIVQEALTNVLRHAEATRAGVVVRHLPDAIEIEVVDDGRGAPPRAVAARGPGLGLIGMRERAAVLGGHLDAGPTAHGGFRVHAVLPVDPPS